MYKKKGSKFSRRYGKNLIALSAELNVSLPSLCSWERQGFDIYFKARELTAVRGNLRLRKCWDNMKSRCGNPKDKKYKYYGGKGIKIKMTRIDLSFLWERDGANKMKQPSIDRMDSMGDYELKNCRFIEMQENRNNP